MVNVRYRYDNKPDGKADGCLQTDQQKAEESTATIGKSDSEMGDLE